MARTGVRRLIPLTLGWEDLPKAVSIHGYDPEVRLTEPVPAVLVLCDGGWLLIDCGFNTSLIRDPALRRRFHADPAYRPLLPGPGEPLPEALAAAGVDLADIRAVALSHLHYDHVGGLRHLAGRVPVHVQQAELSYGLRPDPEPERQGIFRCDFDDAEIDWRAASGDAEIAPGVTAVLTAGHTPGHQSFVVDFDDSVGGGGLVLAFDAADLTENIEGELAVGGFVGVDPIVTVEPIRRLKAIAAERGYPVIPGHDPVAWPRLTQLMQERFAP
ncbi:MAG TPA: N-acyl homoserine lactonase family protein [Acidimicrobiales bacterium]|nr:N-acyl homoserine lactonase family protein [Acidimicrobiales bacterium]